MCGGEELPLVQHHQGPLWVLRWCYLFHSCPVKTIQSENLTVEIISLHFEEQTLPKTGNLQVDDVDDVVSFQLNSSNKQPNFSRTDGQEHNQTNCRRFRIQYLIDYLEESKWHNWYFLLYSLGLLWVLFVLCLLLVLSYLWDPKSNVFIKHLLVSESFLLLNS